MSKLRVGIIGANGYVGSELARLVLTHPALELAAVVSRSHVGRAYAEVVPGLAGFTDITCSDLDPEALCALDVVALATPHGAAKGLVAELAGAKRLLDLSADHRHAAGWVYGQPEWKAAELRGATRIAVPGCFATAINLALAPLVAAGVVRGPVQVAAATGSTGSGATPSAGTHHPERFVNLKAYKVLNHQHVPEVRSFLDTLGNAPRIAFVPMSAPVDRGILAVCFVDVGEADARALVAEAIAPHPLLRLRHESPEIRLVRGTAFCDVSVHQSGDQAVVITAIDNLGRGAAGQGIAALNVALGLPVTEGLFFPPCTP